jgi:negative regulator of sigma E activity
MSKVAGVLAGLLVPAFLIAGVIATPALAQEKKASKGAPEVTRKAITENDKVKVYEVTYALGAENKGIASSTTRVVRALKGGTIERRFADGKTEKVVYKDGDVRIAQPGPAYTTKNVGKTTIHFYVVELK